MPSFALPQFAGGPGHVSGSAEAIPGTKSIARTGRLSLPVFIVGMCCKWPSAAMSAFDTLRTSRTRAYPRQEPDAWTVPLGS